ncbi:MAG TPA: IPT/TIG domain-containing protein [Thermoanaerobaculia bacterium]
MKRVAALVVGFALIAVRSLHAQATNVPLGDGIVFSNYGGIASSTCPPTPRVDVTPNTTLSVTYPACSGTAPFTVSGDFTITVPKPPSATMTKDPSKTYPNNQVLTFSSEVEAEVTAHVNISVAANPQDSNKYFPRLFASAFPSDPIDPKYPTADCPATETCSYNANATLTQGQSANLTVTHTNPIRSVFAFETNETINGVVTHGFYCYIQTEVAFTVNTLTLVGTATTEYFYPVVPASGNTLTGVVKRTYGSKTYWVPDVPVELLDQSGNPIVKTFAQTDATNTAKSSYRMQLPANFDYTQQYRLHIKLQSDPDITIAKLQVFGSPSDTKPLEIFSNPFMLSKDQANITENLNIDRASSDLAHTSTQAAVLFESATEVYWNIWRELYIVRNFIDDRALKLVPLKVYLNAPLTYYCTAVIPPACPASPAIVVQPRDGLPGADPTVLWHEFGHYTFADIHGGPTLPPAFQQSDTTRFNAYHYGYANSYTTLALDDGFATFWAWASSELLDSDHTPQLYFNRITADGTRAERDTGYNSEWNFAAWDVLRPPGASADLPRGEEFAVAGLLWDLHDDAQDVENTTRATWSFGGSSHTPVDTISLPVDQIITIFRNHKPRTVLELYNALKADLASSLTSLGGNPRNSGLSQLDELFVMQGLFYDANGNWTYDYGETIGKVANSAIWTGGVPSPAGTAAPIDIAARPWRENVPPLENSFVNLTFPGTAPQTMTVSYNFGPGLEALNSSRQYSVTSGPFYLEMPSPHYPMEVILSVQNAPPLRIDNQTYWLTPHIDSVASHSFTPTPTPAPAISSLGASSALTGAPVTINGTNFSADPANNIVRFGNAIGFITQLTPTSLTAVTPPIPAGSAPVTVEVNGNVSNSMPFTITASTECRYYVDASGSAFTASGGGSRLFIYTTPACQWSISSQTSWITVDRPGTHFGNLAVQLTVARNSTKSARTGIILINGTSQLQVTEEAGGNPKRREVRH